MEAIYLESNFTWRRVIFQHPLVLPQMTSFDHEMMELQAEMAAVWLRNHPVSRAHHARTRTRTHFRRWKVFVGTSVAWDDLGMGGIASFPLHQ